MNKITVVSLFDGLSGARVALDNLGIPCTYYASEIDKYAIKISEKNYPDIIRMGDVRGIIPTTPKLKVDLLIAGSPCQDLSIANVNRKGLTGKKSGLFWEFVRLKELIEPKYFMLENVASMKKDQKTIITETLGVEPIMINSALVTAQNRKRLYWTNIPGIEQPEDRGIMLQDVLESDIALRQKSLCVMANYSKSNFTNFKKSQGEMIKLGTINSKSSRPYRVYSPKGKAVCLLAIGGGLGAKTGLYLEKGMVRKLSPVECERLQGLPDNYTIGVSNTQRYKMIGNGFTIPVIEHILKNMKE